MGVRFSLEAISFCIFLRSPCLPSLRSEENVFVTGCGAGARMWFCCCAKNVIDMFCLFTCGLNSIFWLLVSSHQYMYSSISIVIQQNCSSKSKSSARCPTRQAQYCTYPTNIQPSKKSFQSSAKAFNDTWDAQNKKYDPGNGRNRTAVGSALLDFNLHNDTCYHYTTSPLAC
jgi:hypothetical protein